MSEVDNDRDYVSNRIRNLDGEAMALSHFSAKGFIAEVTKLVEDKRLGGFVLDTINENRVPWSRAIRDLLMRLEAGLGDSAETRQMAQQLFSDRTRLRRCAVLVAAFPEECRAIENDLRAAVYSAGIHVEMLGSQRDTGPLAEIERRLRWVASILSWRPSIEDDDDGDDGEWVTIAKAAEKTSYSKHQIRRRVVRGKNPLASRGENPIYVRVKDVIEYFAENPPPAGQEKPPNPNS